MERNDPISEVDLCAYIDGELDNARRVEVEEYLSRHPDEAAGVMADLSRSGVLSLAVNGDAAAPSELERMAHRIDRRLFAGRIRRMLPRYATAALAILCLVLVADELAELSGTKSFAVPNFADEALEANDTARLRHTMVTEEKDGSIDRSAVRNIALIDFPMPPPEWRIVDTRLVPSDEGPGLEISFETRSGSPITFFAVRTADQAPASPVATSLGKDAVAYWRRGDIGYALAGEVAPAELDRIAELLAEQRVS